MVFSLWETVGVSTVGLTDNEAEGGEGSGTVVAVAARTEKKNITRKSYNTHSAQVKRLYLLQHLTQLYIKAWIYCRCHCTLYVRKYHIF